MSFQNWIDLLNSFFQGKKQTRSDIPIWRKGSISAEDVQVGSQLKRSLLYAWPCQKVSTPWSRRSKELVKKRRGAVQPARIDEDLQNLWGLLEVQRDKIQVHCES